MTKSQYKELIFFKDSHSAYQNHHSSYSSSETVLISDNDYNSDIKKEKEKETTKLITSNSLNSKKSLKINVMRDLKSAQKLKTAISNTKYSQFTLPNNLNDFISKSFTTPTYHHDHKKDFLNNSQITYSSYDQHYDRREKNNDNLKFNHNFVRENEFNYSTNLKLNQNVNSSTIPRNVDKCTNSQIIKISKNSYLCDPEMECLINKNYESHTESQASFYNDKHLKYLDIKSNEI